GGGRWWLRIARGECTTGERLTSGGSGARLVFGGGPRQTSMALPQPGRAPRQRGEHSRTRSYPIGLAAAAGGTVTLAEEVTAVVARQGLQAPGAPPDEEDWRVLHDRPRAPRASPGG